MFVISRCSLYDLALCSFTKQYQRDRRSHCLHIFKMECGHGDIFIVHNRQHPIESMPKLRRTEKSDMILEEETRNGRSNVPKRERRDMDFVKIERICMDLIKSCWSSYLTSRKITKQSRKITKQGFCSPFFEGFWSSPLTSSKKTKQSSKKTKQSRKITKQSCWSSPLTSRKLTKQLEETRKRLVENQKRLEESTRQFKENKTLLEESTWQLEEATWQLQENKKGLEENQKRLQENKKALEESTWQLEENQKRLEESTWQLEENQKRLQENKKALEESTWQSQENKKLLEESTWQLEENQKRFEESTWQLKENKKGLEENRKRLKESIWQLEENQKRLKESTWQLEESTWQLEGNKKRLEGNKKRLEGNKKREGTRRLVKPHQGLIAPKYKPRPQLTTSWILFVALLMMQLVGLCCGATGNTDCLTTQSVLLGSQGIIRCRLFENSTRFFWYDTNIEGGDTLLIKLENGRINGIGYTSGEFNIDSDGSLIINSVTAQHERVFHFESVSPNLIRSTNEITVIVYVEPIEPVPVITECLGKSACIMKGNLDGVISCVHHNTRPAATISWFMRYGTHDIPLNSNTNQTLSADLITFSVASEMAIGEIPLLVNMQSLVLLVCKSHNPYSVVQESDSKVLLDLSQNDPFEKQPDLVYAIQNQDLVIECPLTIAAEVSIVMWMAKSLEAKNSGYLTYSAYGVVPSKETNEQLNLDKSGDLVISQVGLKHDGLYACIQSTGSTTKSFLQRVEVIVQPTPPKVLVEGCNLFEPCSFHITETKAITCQVNGVYPEVDLEIIVLSTNLAVIYTKVSTYEDEGLFYTSIQGDVIVVDASCQVNETIICQAGGPAANVFKSDALISISTNGVKCPQSSAAPFPACKEVHINVLLIISLTMVVTMLCVFLAYTVICKYLAMPNGHSSVKATSVTETEIISLN